MAKSVKEYERLKSPKSKGLQEFARIANGAKVIPDDEVIRQINSVFSRAGSPINTRKLTKFDQKVFGKNSVYYNAYYNKFVS